MKAKKAKAESGPDGLNFSIGGDRPHPFTVARVASGQIEVQRTSSSETESIEVPPERWERFWNEVEKIGVWKWKPNYARAKSDHAISWELEITHAGRRFKARGRNAYPEANEPGNDVSYPPGGQFDRFIQAIARLAAIPVDQIESEPSDYD